MILNRSQSQKFIVMTLDDRKLLYVYRYKTTKEMWDTLEMTYELSPSIKLELINT